MGDMDMRSIVEGAWNEAEANEAAAPTPDGNGAGDAGAARLDAVPAPADAGDDQRANVSTEATEAGAAAQRARDAAGRFAPKGKEVSQVKAPTPGVTSSAEPTNPPLPGGDPSKPAAPAPVVEALRPPQSWKPDAREAFAKAPPEVQREVLRVDREVRQVMQESAPARRFHQEMTQTLQPYEQLIRESGMDPIRATQNLFQTVHALRTGDANAKANIVAGMIKSFGVPIEALAAAIDAAPAQAQRPPPPPVDPGQIAAQVRQQLEQDWVTRQANTEVQKFHDDAKNDLLHGEHGQRVWAAMMAQVQAAAMQQQDLSLGQAYEAATWALPETRAIVQKRAAAEAAKAQQASTQQARNAASSVRSTPSTGASSARTPKTHREIVESAWDSLDGR